MEIHQTVTNILQSVGLVGHHDQGLHFFKQWEKKEMQLHGR
jgi:hypothetical protein